MSEIEVSRRRLMQLGMGAAATAGFLTSGVQEALAAVSSPNGNASLTAANKDLQSSIENAYKFLNQMMDAFAQGSTIRLCQSYSDQIAGGTFYSTAFIYDNALLALAYLSRGKG